MNTQKLIEALDNLRTVSDRSPEEQIFLRLLAQVWQIDWTVAPYDVFTHMIEWDIAYFKRFMDMDEGDEAEEEKLLQDWVSARSALRGKNTGREWKQQMINLISEANQTRSTIRREA